MSSTDGNPYPSAFSNPKPPEKANEIQRDGELHPKKSKRKRIWFWLSITALVFFLVGIISFIVMLEQVKAGKYGELPSSEILENPKNPLATTVFTGDKKVLGKYYRERRTNVTKEEISDNVFNALVATEDERFYNHSGIDFMALFRVMVKTIVLQDRSAGGGSTLSQQLAKNMFELRRDYQENPIYIKKMQEWVLAVRLERKYTKDEILTMYLNTVDFLSGAMGIYEASHTYYGKDPIDLDLVEAAGLVAMLKAPGTYNVKSQPENNKGRRAVVYNQMLRNGLLNRKQYDSLKTLDVEIHFSDESHNSGSAQYFREQLRLQLHRWGKANGYDVYRDGLRVYTTIDSRIQAHAEKASADHMKYLQGKFNEHWKGRSKPWEKDLSLRHRVIHSNRYHYYRKKYKKEGKPFGEEEIKEVFSTPRKMKVFSYKGEIDTTMSPMDSINYYQNFLHVGFMAMDQSTGKILAWVGGVNQKYFKYDHVNVNAKRQVGSTFKPFVFLKGLESKYYPCFQAANVPVVFEFVSGVDDDGKDVVETWSPKNSDNKYGGKMTLQQGLSGSVNCITAYVMQKVGPEAVVRRAQDLGIGRKYPGAYQTQLEAVPSLCLGTADISVFEMTAAFNTFNNGGVWVEPTLISRIEDRFGNVIAEFAPVKQTVIDDQTNYAMVKMLQRVVRRGTAGRLPSSNYYNIKTALAGKTGTTQEAADGWFIGFQPGITAGCWVGGEIRQVAFRDMKYGQGARMAMPIFGDFIVAINADSTLNYGEEWEFPKPIGELPFTMDCPDIRYDPDDPNLGIKEDDDPDFEGFDD